MDPYGSVWSLRTPWGLPGASWGPGGAKRGVKGFSPPGRPGGPSWVASLLALRGLIGFLLAYVGSSLICPQGLLMVWPYVLFMVGTPAARQNPYFHEAEAVLPRLSIFHQKAAQGGRGRISEDRRKS